MDTSLAIGLAAIVGAFGFGAHLVLDAWKDTARRDAQDADREREALTAENNQLRVHVQALTEQARATAAENRRLRDESRVMANRINVLADDARQLRPAPRAYRPSRDDLLGTLAGAYTYPAHSHKVLDGDLVVDMADLVVVLLASGDAAARAEAMTRGADWERAEGFLEALDRRGRFGPERQAKALAEAEAAAEAEPVTRRVDL